MSQRFSGFVPIPLVIELDTSAPSSSSSLKKKVTTADINHYIFIKEHKGSRSASSTATSAGPKSTSATQTASKALLSTLAAAGLEEFPENRTLFIANLPVDYNVREDTQKIFGEYGPVERVIVKENEQQSLAGGLGGVGDWVDSDDEDEQDDEDEEMDSADEQEEAKVIEGQTPETKSASQPLGRRRRHRSDRQTQKKSKIPEIIPLPPLDPRTTSPLLPTNSSAYIIFLDPLSLQRALTLSPTRRPVRLIRTLSNPPLGIPYYTALYDTLRPRLEDLKTHADSCIALYDHHFLAMKSKQSAGEIVDEDGFTLVVRGGRFGRTAGKGDKGVAVASRRFMLETGSKLKELKKMKVGEGDDLAGMALDVDAREGLERGKKRKNRLELDGFYGFQTNEKKRQGETRFLLLCLCLPISHYCLC